MMSGNSAEQQWLVDEQGQRWFIFQQGMNADNVPAGVTHVVFKEGMAHILNQTFDNQMGRGRFDSLKCLKIAATVTEIGRWAFDGCGSLVKVEIPPDSSLATIETGGFRNCASLQDISLPKSLPSLGDLTFHGCSALTTIYFPPQLEAPLGEDCFGCSGLKEVDLGHCRLLTIILDGAFANCKKLETVVLPPNLEIIDAKAFQGCTALKMIAFPRQMQYITENAFKDCSALATVEFASFASISAIMGDPRKARFAGCTQLHSVKWSPNQGPAIPPAIWSQIISKIFWCEVGLLESLPAKNRHSCIFSFLCSIREELLENQLHTTSHSSRPPLPIHMETPDAKRVHRTTGTAGS